MVDFIQSTLFAAVMLWGAAFALQSFGFDVAYIFTALSAFVLSGIGLGAVLAGSVVWAARHIRITII